MRIYALFLFSVLSIVAHGSEQALNGKNCDIETPPESSGELANHGAIFRVHPRSIVINEGYTGCQSLWEPIDNNWKLIWMVFIESGMPVEMWEGKENKPRNLICKYKEGILVSGDKGTCGSPKSLILRTRAPGCYEKIKKRWKAYDEKKNMEAYPKGCRYK